MIMPPTVVILLQIKWDVDMVDRTNDDTNNGFSWNNNATSSGFFYFNPEEIMVD